MRLLFFLLSIPIFISAKAQTVLNNAFVKAGMEIYSESNGNVSVSAGGTTDIEIYLKDSMSKVSRSIHTNFKSNTIMNINSDLSIHLFENNLGEKKGFTYTALDKQNQKRRTDSIAKIQQENIGGEAGTFTTSVKVGVDVVKNILYVEELKTINGLDCKKAIVTIKSMDGEDSKINVWYTPAYILPGGVGGEKGMMSIEGLKGMPIYYESVKTINVSGNDILLTTIYQVLEIKSSVKMEDSTFNIPLGYTLQTYTDWLKENPGGIQKR